jgi:hypothetical protein
MRPATSVGEQIRKASESSTGEIDLLQRGRLDALYIELQALREWSFFESKGFAEVRVSQPSRMRIDLSWTGEAQLSFDVPLRGDDVSGIRFMDGQIRVWHGSDAVDECWEWFLTQPKKSQ